MAAHAAPPKKTSWFAVGGPVFNLAMVVVLMGVSTFIVMSPAEGAFDELEERAAAQAAQLATGGWPQSLAFADLSRSTTPTPMPTPSPSPTPNAEPVGNGGGARGADLDDPGGDGRVGEPVPPAGIPSTERYEPPPVLPTPTAVPTATPQPTPTPRPTATPTPRPRPTATPRPTPTPDVRPTCSDFAHRGEAQVAFDADPENLPHMDGDGDGLACEQLPAPPPPPIPSSGDVLATTGIYGVHTRDAPWWMGEVDHLARLTGRTPGTLLFFSNFAQAFPAGPVDTAWSRGMIPVLAWEPIVPGAARQPRLIEIIDGTFDAYIDEWAAAARDHGAPVVLRFAAEMNGNWYPWSESVNGNNRGEYVQAWRHLHDRFEAQGADNVIWLWSTNRVDSLSTTLADFYPGDEYVDWIGMAGYWREVKAGRPPTFATTFGRTLEELRAISSKPILLSEIGAGTDEANKIAWIRSFFRGVAASPDIIGFIWFNDQKSGGDWRLQVSQGIVNAFADGVADPRWRTGIDPGGMIPGQRITVPASGVS